MKIKYAFLIMPLFLISCGKPFPIEDALYAEYKAIVCKIPSGEVTPELVMRQLEINKLFEEKLKQGGQPSADWITTHAKKLQDVLDTKTCVAATSAVIPAPSSAAPADAPQPVAVAAAPAKDKNDTCTAGTKTIFSCMTEKGKRIELCDGGGKITYTFGPPNEPELTLKVDRAVATTNQWEGIGSSMYYSVNLKNGKTNYSVFTNADKNSQEFTAGVDVSNSVKSLAVVKCAGDGLYGVEGIDLKKAD